MISYIDESASPEAGSCFIKVEYYKPSKSKNMLDKKELLANQLKTDIKLWLADLEPISNDEIFSPIKEAKDIMLKVKKYLEL